MRWFVIVEHEVDDIAGGSNEEELEAGKVEGFGKGPEEVCEAHKRW